MSDSHTAHHTRNTGGVRVVGLLSILAGIVLIIAGAATWYVVTDQLKAQDITVAEDAEWFGGKQVNGPLDAYSEAQVIEKHALEATGGKTYAQLEQDDPVREVAMNASFLRASLFTSVVAYGVAAFAMGMGVLWLLLGWSLRKLA
ncbi:aromatic ring-opening dioxygenase LigA [Aeromicrobium sp. 636]|uniref:Aromatic ring-opening dioxygenase LigA n=1 Tax=Aeromicrobium senzhongii TaxID=2663859 RepID=A0A8I0K088_9ACTN|nr:MULTISPECIES: aromatic ring-opening dioxygenase LigA [Aeromicrobium]MBC9226777.1 aromatic ring-opening dioxygenase LigA [Aeromicrobium senzhongii]MCQ3998878.1 aromatic ring-opening dioxygenase LigA [Aeromicrobium sp. 636]MTB89302.1 aromatic ring-opening dioxygenase LigA [Aeromicrobium senzhongii]QNL93436.1 aromatic ring-opening dioxygenase LigA [Aeromicrobium senzhongii]